MLSSDVSAAFDPNYASAFEKKNIAYLGRGMVFNKYTGSRGKSGSNDACAEYIGELRSIMDADGVCWQTAELGKMCIRDRFRSQPVTSTWLSVHKFFIKKYKIHLTKHYRECYLKLQEMLALLHVEC